MPIVNNDFSRFRFSEPIITKDMGDINYIETFGLWTRPDFLKIENVPENQITLLQIDQSNEGRPDKIANDFYGSPFLEWIVIMFNRPLNPLGFPKAGTTIRLPSSSVVFSGL